MPHVGVGFFLFKGAHAQVYKHMAKSEMSRHTPTYFFSQPISNSANFFLSLSPL